MLTDTQPIRLKGRSFLALVLSPAVPLDDWLVRFDDLATRSAGYFLKRPVVLDVAGVEIDRAQLKDLIGQLGRRGVRIMGIEGASSSMLDPDMPPAMNDGLPASEFDAADGDPGARVRSDSNGATPSIIVTEPIRSGQSLSSNGDIIIVGSVASGAEVVAGGSIHVYGSLRGRAFAGSMGKTSARIFCQKLEAELVAIAGFYKTSEDLEPGLYGRAVQVRRECDLILVDILC